MPYGLAKAVLNYLHLDVVVSLKYTVDAGCGNGIWGRAFQEVFGDDYIIDGVDIRLPTAPLPYSCFHHTDYLTWNPEMSPTLIIGNPPFRLIEQFVRHSWEISDYGGVICFLGRLEFLASRRRQEGLFAECPLNQVAVLTRRPSFFSTKGSKTTDAMDYAVFIWVAGESAPKAILDWLYWEY